MFNFKSIFALLPVVFFSLWVPFKFDPGHVQLYNHSAIQYNTIQTYCPCGETDLVAVNTIEHETSHVLKII